MLGIPYARAWDSIVAPGAGFAIDISDLSCIPWNRRLLTGSESTLGSVREFHRFSDEVLMRVIPSVDSLKVSCKSHWSRPMATTREIVQGMPQRSMSLPVSERLSVPAATSPVRLSPGVQEFKDRRRRRRINLQPMYTAVSVRVLSKRDVPLEGHAVNLSETGIVVEVDNTIPIGHAVTLEFQVSGLGRLRDEQWPTYAVAAEVVRIDNLAEFPHGPYRVAMRFVRIPTMTQAAIARYVATHESKTLS
jgi:hypothetical protein